MFLFAGGHTLNIRRKAQVSSMMTEYEWRKQRERRRKYSEPCCAARCILDHTEPLHMARRHWFALTLLLLSFLFAAEMILFAPLNPMEWAKNAHPESKRADVTPIISPRQISAVSYVFPQELVRMTRSFRREELLNGKILLIDEKHPLPQELPAPNTMSIASYAKGAIPVRNLKIRSGIETMNALTELFAVLREKGVQGLTVWQGTLSRAEQREQQKVFFRSRMAVSAPDRAFEETIEQLDWPGTGELQQEYTVELRFHAGTPQQAEEKRFEESRRGQTLLQNAWRYGLIRSNPKASGREAFRFRYVGKAHATAMTYLDLGLEEYLEWLRQKEVMVIADAAGPQYIILSKPLENGRAELILPQDASIEASLDHAGNAVVACTLRRQ